MAATVDKDDGREVVVGGTELMERVGIDRVLDACRYVLSILSTSSVSLMKAAISSTAMLLIFSIVRKRSILYGTDVGTRSRNRSMTMQKETLNRAAQSWAMPARHLVT